MPTRWPIIRLRSGGVRGTGTLVQYVYVNAGPSIAVLTALHNVCERALCRQGALAWRGGERPQIDADFTAVGEPTVELQLEPMGWPRIPRSSYSIELDWIVLRITRCGVDSSPSYQTLAQTLGRPWLLEKRVSRGEPVHLRGYVEDVALTETGTLVEPDTEADVEGVRRAAHQFRTDSFAPVAGHSGGPVVVMRDGGSVGSVIGIMRRARSVHHAQPHTSFATRATDILEQCPALDASAAIPPDFQLPSAVPPFELAHLFRYVSAFDEMSAHAFWARDAETAELARWFLSEGTPKILLLFAPSGAGKSSLLGASLVPRAKAHHVVHIFEGVGWRDARLRVLARLGAPVADSDPSGFTDPTRLTETWSRLWRACETLEQRPFTIVLDQAERFLEDLRDERWQTDFCSLLESATHVRGRVVIAFRAEHLAYVRAVIKRSQANCPTYDMFLEPLRAAQLSTIITRLGESLDLSAVEGDMRRVIVEGNLPATLMQVLLTRAYETWQSTGARPEFSVDTWDAAKVLTVDRFVDDQLHAAQKELRDVADPGLVLDVLAFHVDPTTPASRPRTREVLLNSYGSRAVADGPVDRALHKLIDVRLLRESGPLTGLAHDSLAKRVGEIVAESTEPCQRARVWLLQARAGADLPRAAKEVIKKARARSATPGGFEQEVAHLEQEWSAGRARRIKVAIGASIALVAVAGIASNIPEERVSVRDRPGETPLAARVDIAEHWDKQGHEKTMSLVSFLRDGGAAPGLKAKVRAAIVNAYCHSPGRVANGIRDYEAPTLEKVGDELVIRTADYRFPYAMKIWSQTVQSEVDSVVVRESVAAFHTEADQVGVADTQGNVRLLSGVFASRSEELSWHANNLLLLGANAWYVGQNSQGLDVARIGGVSAIPPGALEVTKTLDGRFIFLVGSSQKRHLTEVVPTNKPPLEVPFATRLHAGGVVTLTCDHTKAAADDCPDEVLFPDAPPEAHTPDTSSPRIKEDAATRCPLEKCREMGLRCVDGRGAFTKNNALYRRCFPKKEVRCDRLVGDKWLSVSTNECETDVGKSEFLELDSSTGDLAWMALPPPPLEDVFYYLQLSKDRLVTTSTEGSQNYLVEVHPFTGERVRRRLDDWPAEILDGNRQLRATLNGRAVVLLSTQKSVVAFVADSAIGRYEFPCNQCIPQNVASSSTGVSVLLQHAQNTVPNVGDDEVFLLAKLTSKGWTVGTEFAAKRSLGGVQGGVRVCWESRGQFQFACDDQLSGRVNWDIEQSLLAWSHVTLGGSSEGILVDGREASEFIPFIKARGEVIAYESDGWAIGTANFGVVDAQERLELAQIFNAEEPRRHSPVGFLDAPSAFVTREGQRAYVWPFEPIAEQTPWFESFVDVLLEKDVPLRQSQLRALVPNLEKAASESPMAQRLLDCVSPWDRPDLGKSMVTPALQPLW